MKKYILTLALIFVTWTYGWAADTTIYGLTDKSASIATTYTLLCDVNANTAGDTGKCTISSLKTLLGLPTDLAITSQAAGDIIYYNGTNWVRLAKGTAYQILNTNSGATAPAWTSTLGVTGTRLTKIWATDLEITNLPTINGGTLVTALGLSSYLLLTGGTLSGDLALGAHNLTLTGSIAATGNRSTKGWFTDLEITNLPTIGGSTLASALGIASYLPLAGGTLTGDLALTTHNITLTGSLAATGSRATKGWFTNLEITNLPTVNGGTLATALGIANYLPLAGGTMTQPMIGPTPAAGAGGYASIRMPHGVAPTTNLTNGDCWTTTAGLYCRINGATVGPYAIAGAVTGFDTITAGTNAAALHIGTGGSLDTTGTGTIDATTLGGASFAAPGAIGGTTPAAGTFTSVTIPKVASTAGQNCMYDDYGTEAYGDCWRGSHQTGALGASRIYALPTDPPGGGVMVFPTPTGALSTATWLDFGTGVPAALATNIGSAGAPMIKIASGSIALSTGSIASQACQTVTAGSVNSASATGVTTTDVITVTPNATIKGKTGYAPLTAGGLDIVPYPTTNYVNFDVCNRSANSISPDAVTLNWYVIR